MPYEVGVDEVQGKSEAPKSHDLKASKIEEDLKPFRTTHQWDPNLEIDKRDQIDAALNAHDTGLETAIEGELEESSPYLEVAGTVRNTDDFDMPANTIRAWVLGLLFTTTGSALNMLFNLRDPRIQISSTVAQLVSYPIGASTNFVWKSQHPK